MGRILLSIFAIVLILIVIANIQIARRKKSARSARKAELERQIQKAEEDLRVFNVRGNGQCPYCYNEVENSAIKCVQCGGQFWMTRIESIRSKEVGRARIEKIQEMLTNIT